LSTRPGRVLLAGGLAAALALPALAGAADAPDLLAGAPRVERVAVAAAPGGDVVLDVRVAHPALSRAAPGRIHREAAQHEAVLRVTLSGPRGGVLAAGGARTGALLGAPGGRVAVTHRIRLRGPAANRVRSLAGRATSIRIGVVAVSRLHRDGDPRPRATSVGRRTLALPARPSWSAAPAAPRAPTCERARSVAPVGDVVRIAVRCQGATRLTLARGPGSGTARLVAVRNGRALVDYRAPDRRVTDRVTLRAAGPGGVTTTTRAVTVRGPVMRALGDSVTAGFGFLGDGTEMSALELPRCFPGAPLNDRCSSNSPNGPGTGGTPVYLPDFGLSNGVAWPAQFAIGAGLEGATAFQNLAVSGSTPGNWDTGGALAPTLAGIVADQPDLTVMTLGANPLLDSFLFGGGLRCELTLSEAQFRACVEGFISRYALVPRLGSVIGRLLEAPTNHVVVSQYHQAIPASSVFSVSSLRIMGELLNGAVAEAARARPEFGTRVFLMAPPRFPVGVPPGDAICTRTPLGALVDGASRQSDVTQDELAVFERSTFCGSEEFWIISADTGIHPSRAGHAQFAAALAQVVAENGLLPRG